MRTLLLPAAALAAALAGCQTAQAPQPAQIDAAYELSTRLAAVIGRCWFAPANPLLPDYSYSPERNANQSRILIVRKDNPTALPVLVIEPKGGSSVDVYGPLLGTSEGPRLKADVDRWTRGDEGCAT